MSSHRFRALGVLLALASLGGPRALAQSEPATIPTPLAMALLGIGATRAGAPPRLAVDATPVGWPAALAPASLKALGGMRQSAASLVAIFADSAGPPLAAYQALLLANGFTRPVSNEPGFQSSGTPGNYYCRDSTIVTPYAISSGATTARLLRVNYSVNPMMAARCLGAPDSPPSFRTEPVRLRVPRLVTPPGAQQGPSSSGGGWDDLSSSATITDASRSAAEMGRYYAGQIAAAGWGVLPPVANDRVSATALDARDSTGAPWHGVLLVERHGTQHQVTLTMSPVERR